jgi:hypothetical protein
MGGCARANELLTNHRACKLFHAVQPLCKTLMDRSCSGAGASRIARYRDRRSRHNTFTGRSLLFGRVSAQGPSRLAGFLLVGFGAEVASGSSDSTMAISSPGSGSELREGRR